MEPSVPVVLLLLCGTGRAPLEERATELTLEGLLAGSGVNLRAEPVEDENNRVAASPDDELDAAMKRMRATMAIAVCWDDARATIHLRGTRERTMRSLQFAPQDAPSERGRAAAFAIAAAIPAAPPTPPAPVPSHRPAPTAAPQAAPRTSVEALVTLVNGLGESGAGGVGGTLGVRVRVLSSLALHGSVAGRFGTASSASASTRVLTGSLGAAFTIASPPPFQVSIRADAIVQQIDLAHFSGDEPAPVHLSMWSPGASAVLEGALKLSEGTALVLGSGTEVAFATADVYVKGAKRMSLPPVRLVGEAGIRAYF